jgi:protein-disulfide isomerase
MTNGESHGQHEHHEHHSHHHEKKDETFKFEVSKVRIWQGLAVILAIAVVFLWFNQGSGGAPQGQVQIPNLQQPQPSPNPSPQQQAPARLDNIDEDDDPVLGDNNAPVTIVSFEDYQCPFCKRAKDQTFPQLKQEYIDTGKVRYIYRDFPLSFHPQAQPAAEASECADDQGKFWEYHEALFANQATLGRDLYIQLAGQFGMDVEEFTSCFDSGKFKQEVQNDFTYGSQVGVSGTPTFFINGVKLVGAQPYQAFKQVIDSELAG